MGYFKHLSIQSKLTVMLLFVSISSIVAVGIIAYGSGKEALTTAVFDQLTNLRASRATQIEAQFKTARNQTSNLADDRMIVDLMKGLRGAFDKLQDVKIQPEWVAKLETFYKDDFLPKLAKATGETPDVADYLPASPVARYLQYQYIANNPSPVGQKYHLDDAHDGSEYSAIHAQYQRILTKFVLDFHFDNIFLVNNDTGDVVYTFTKSPLFATNILTGPYSDTTATELCKSLRKAKDRDEVLVADFSYFASAMGKPVALMASPIFDGANQIGILFIQLPIDEINRVMTDDFGWVNDGLGATGECYLVGPDKLMRSRSRLLHEDPEKYYRTLETAGYSKDDIDRVRRAGTALLAQPVRTMAVEDAMEGRTSTRIVTNYRGESSLACSAPLNIPGLRWNIVAEMQTDEAFAPLDRLTRKIVISSVVIVIVVTLIAMLLGRLFVRPIDRLVEGVQRLESGESGVEVDLKSKDEFADLGAAFNAMSRSLKVKTDLLQQKTRQNEDLLLSVFPPQAAARFSEGRERLTEEFQDVTVLFAKLIGFTPLLDAMPREKSVGLLSDLVSAMDEAAERLGIDKLTASAGSYQAVCGMSAPRLDHASRIVDFALEIVRLAQRFSQDQKTKIIARIGVNSGSAIGAVVGKTKLNFMLWGRTVDIALGIRGTSACSSISVAQPCYELIGDLYLFGDPIKVSMEGGEDTTLWPLRTVPGAVKTAQVEGAQSGA